MKIEYKEKPETEVRQGDIIKFENEVIGLVVDKGGWEHEICKGYLAVVLLKYESGDDWLQLANGYQSDFEAGNYKIIGNMENAKLILWGENEWI